MAFRAPGRAISGVRLLSWKVLGDWEASSGLRLA
jgi:hypothetical protein